MNSIIDTAAGGVELVSDRRQFLRASLAAAGCLLLDVRAPPSFADPTHPIFAPDAFIRIEASGNVTLIMPQTEMGQGIYTAVAAILAEELDADLNQVTLEAAPPDIGARLLDAAAQDRREGAVHAGTGRRYALEG